MKFISGYNTKDINDALRNGKPVLAKPVDLQNPSPLRIYGIKTIRTTGETYGRTAQGQAIRIFDAWPEYCERN